MNSAPYAVKKLVNSLSLKNRSIIPWCVIVNDLNLVQSHGMRGEHKCFPTNSVFQKISSFPYEINKACKTQLLYASDLGQRWLLFQTRLVQKDIFIFNSSLIL